MKKNFKPGFGAGMLAAILSLITFPAFATSYSIVEAPTALPPSIAYPGFLRNPPGMNNLGQIVGEKMLWSGGMTVELGPFLQPGFTRYPAFSPTGPAWRWGSIVGVHDINDNGQMAGTTEIGTAYVPCGGGAFRAIILSGGTFDCVDDVWDQSRIVNSLGQIAGFRIDSPTQAFFWDPTADRFIRLPYFMDPNYPYDEPVAVPLDMNDMGVMVGYSFAQVPSPPFYALRWTTAGTPTVQDLGKLGGAIAAATGINNAGKIVGWSETASGDTHAFAWQEGVMTDLGAFTANDISEADQIVGAQTVGSESRAVLYENGTLTDLNTFLPAGSGWVLTSATQINERGQIIGKGTLNGTVTGFLLSPDTAPLGNANLRLEFTPSQNPYVSSALNYSGTLTNLGPEEATGVVLVAGYPIAPEYVVDGGADPVLSRGVCQKAVASPMTFVHGDNDNFRWCTIGTMAPGESIAFSLDVTADMASHSTHLVARLFGQKYDNDTSDNRLELVIENGTFTNSDIVVTGTAAPDPVHVGQQVTQSFVITNQGPEEAINVNLLTSDNSSVTFVSATSSQGGGCTRTIIGITITCNLGNIPVSGTATVTIVVIPNTAKTLFWSAVVNYAGDPNNGNNNTYTTTTVLPIADLSLAITDTPDPVLFGGTVTYTITATNNGPSPAGNVTATGTLPSCSFGALASGASASCTRTAIADSEGTLMQTMIVSATENDPNMANNSASADTVVLSGADLALIMTDSPDPVKRGAKLTYEMTVTNSGPRDATGVMLTNHLPANVIFVKAVTTQGSCTGTATVICSLGSLASGASANVTVVIKPKSTGTISNTATATANEADPNGGNNNAAVDTVVKR